MSNEESKLVGTVCKHSSYNTSAFRKGNDLTCFKLTDIYEDGTKKNRLVAIENFKQPFWIVKPKYRKFEQHKDYIEEFKVREYKAPRQKIGYVVKSQLFNVADRNATVRDVAGSQYVFGLDQTPCVHIKQRFADKYPELSQTEAYTVAAYDIETCMFKEGGPIIMASVTMKERAYFAAVRSWFPDKDDETILRKLKEAENKYIRSRLDRRNCVVEYELFDTPGQVAEANVRKFHEFSPDWVVSWNAIFDMERTSLALEQEGYDLPEVYSDPSIPKEYRKYEFIPGRTHKTKENGEQTSLEPQEKFPVTRGMSNWQWFDAMSAYAIKRVAGGKLEKYSLEFVADLNDIEGKLYTEEGAHKGPGTGPWHAYMQKEHPYLYAMYNIIDNIVIEEIDDKTGDYSLTLPLLLGSSELETFPSQPKRISDKLSFYARTMGYVWGSTPPKRDKNIKDNLPTLGDWIALLDTEKNASVGKVIFEGLDDVVSQGRSNTSDIDVEGAYPNAGVTLNIANKTTAIEVCRIQGADPLKFREIAINYTSSPEANAVQLAHDLFRFPSFRNLEEVFMEKIKELGYEEDFMKMVEEQNK